MAGLPLRTLGSMVTGDTRFHACGRSVTGGFTLGSHAVSCLHLGSVSLPDSGSYENFDIPNVEASKYGEFLNLVILHHT